jgi:cytochrome d ubiquinol oxidase subunit I
VIPFFAFRVMVGCGLLMLALAWYGNLQIMRRKIEGQRWLLWGLFLSFPLGFIATLTGWFTAEVGRQPWTVFGQLRTADAVTPFLTAPQVATTLVVFGIAYTIIFLFGALFIYRLLRRGPVEPAINLGDRNPKRPLSGAGETTEADIMKNLPAGEKLS